MENLKTEHLLAEEVAANGNGAVHKRVHKATSSVGRGKTITRNIAPETSLWRDDFVSLSFGDSLDYYSKWEQPTVIISDGAYYYNAKFPNAARRARMRFRWETAAA